MLLTTVLLLLLCSGSSSLLFFFVSFHNSLCIFLQVDPIFPIFDNVDPIIVVLNPSFDWFFIFFFFKYLFEEIVDVVFPSFSLAYRSLCWSCILNSDLGSIQQAAFFNHLSLGDVALLSANFHFIFCVFCSSIESLHVPIRSNPLLQSQLYLFPFQSLHQMSLHCPRRLQILCSDHHRFLHQCCNFQSCQQFLPHLCAQ